MKSLFKFAFGAALMLLSSLSILNAQTNLSVQGTIQNFNGSAVDNGLYDVIFKLYTTDAGGTAVWSETQSVQVTGGVYSVLLGSVTPLTAAFDQTYYLGITLPGGPELTPRSRLTSSPYALSLIGQDNIFPSTGTVGIGTASPATGNELHVKDAAAAANVLVEGATDAKVTISGTDGAELLFKKGANEASITYDGTNINVEGLNLVFDAGINLPAGQTISYNSVSDWRLVDVDNFETSTDGWVCHERWNLNTPTKNFERASPNTPFSEGYFLRPTDAGDDALKKQFNLTGIAHTMVKVVFTYHFLDSWSPGEAGFAMFSTANNTPENNSQDGNMQVGWFMVSPTPTPNFGGRGYYGGNFGGVADFNQRVEMVAQDSGDTFWLIMASSLDEAASNESYAISNVEIWVK
jgi:hypothetical protein